MVAFLLPLLRTIHIQYYALGTISTTTTTIITTTTITTTPNTATAITTTSTTTTTPTLVHDITTRVVLDQVAREELGEECDYEKEAANQVMCS